MAASGQLAEKAICYTTGVPCSSTGGRKFVPAFATIIQLHARCDGA